MSERLTYTVGEAAKAIGVSRGLTIVMTMHDLNQVARYSRRVIALRDGRIFRDGAPADVLTPEVLRQVFGVDAYVFTDDETGQLVCLPYARSDGHVPLNNHKNHKNHASRKR